MELQGTTEQLQGLIFQGGLHSFVFFFLMLICTTLILLQ